MISLAHSPPQEKKEEKDEKSLLQKYISDLIVDMANYFAKLDSVMATIIELKRNKANHSLLLSILEELASNSSSQIRRYAAILFGVSIPLVAMQPFSLG